MSIKNIAILLLVVAILVAGCMSKPQQAQAPQQIQIIQEQEKSIQTIGTGEVKVRPDLVRFVITVETAQKELTPAKEENEKITQAVLAVLKKYEIANDDIKEDYLKQEAQGSVSRVYLYKIQQNIKVTLRDLTKLEPLFTDILKAGAFQISSIRFQISNVDLYKDQALTLAVADARRKAEVMAEELGQEAGKALKISENNGYDTYQYEYSNAFMTNSLDSELAFADINPYAFNETSIHATVTVEFQLK